MENSTDQQVSTLFSIESKNGLNTYYIDYHPDDIRPYRLYKDEKYLCSRESLGEVLEILFKMIGSTNLKLI